MVAKGVAQMRMRMTLASLMFVVAAAVAYGSTIDAGIDDDPTNCAPQVQQPPAPPEPPQNVQVDIDVHYPPAPPAAKAGSPARSRRRAAPPRLPANAGSTGSRVTHSELEAIVASLEERIKAAIREGDMATILEARKQYGELETQYGSQLEELRETDHETDKRISVLEAKMEWTHEEVGDIRRALYGRALGEDGESPFAPMPTDPSELGDSESAPDLGATEEVAATFDAASGNESNASSKARIPGGGLVVLLAILGLVVGGIREYQRQEAAIASTAAGTTPPPMNRIGVAIWAGGGLAIGVVAGFLLWYVLALFGLA